MQTSYYLLALLAGAIPIASERLAEDGSLSRSCQDIREQGFTQVGHYVVYHTVNNTEEAAIIYCYEKDGMQLLEDRDRFEQRSLLKNCKDLQDQGMDHDGVNIIYPFAEHPNNAVLVVCDQTTQGGGWTLINRRDENYEQPEDFDRTFEEYEDGFGDINYDFYIGNEVVHALVDSSMNELYVDIEDRDGVTGYAHYKYFHVGARDAHVQHEPPYMMDSGFYEGTIGEGLGYHNGMGFSTYDQDNDIADKNCADLNGGGWWYKACLYSHLNGPYGSGSFRWSTLEQTYLLRKARMMVRPSAAA